MVYEISYLAIIFGLMKTPLFLIGINIMLFPLLLNAQKDSSDLNLGHTTVSRHFTQNIVVKGEDLARFPFSSLSEAINVYFSGAYSDAAYLTYVIDGNLSNDVNAYSIYDIESITLVQNALALINGAENPSQMLLIQTKRGKFAPKGIQIAASSYLLQPRVAKVGKQESVTSPDFFHQYHISGSYAGKRIEMGASVNFMREAAVIPKYEHNTDGDGATNRFRINAWLNKRLGKSSELSVAMNVVPQSKNYDTVIDMGLSSIYKRHLKGKQFVIFPSIRLSTNITSSVTNELSVSYLRSGNKEDGQTLYKINTNSQDYINYNNADLKYSSFLLREQISFEKKVKGWIIQPSLGLFFNRVKMGQELNNYTISEGGMFVGTFSTSEKKLSTFASTPSVQFTYRNFLHIDAGAQWISTGTSVFNRYIKKFNPFASFTVDLLSKNEQDNSWKIYGSWAERESPSLPISTGPYLTELYLTTGVQNFIISPLFPASFSSNMIMLGSALSIKEDRLLISYSFEKRKYHQPIILPNSYSRPGILDDAEVKLSSHRLGVQYLVEETTRFRWQTSANITSLTSDIVYPEMFYYYPSALNTGYPLPGLSGGWTNHFRFNRFTAGLNMLYFFDEEYTQIASTPPNYNLHEVVSKENSLILQHIYLGYLLQVKGKTSEIYGSARNPLQSKNSTIASGRTLYYGLGVHWHL